ncbi:MAG TPA: AAA family ATPase [Gammaproteobacteria bacterium]|nr:AAA family ATPase [Gammaproteobacteria bacterium]
MGQDKLSVEVQSLIDAQDHPFVLIDDNYNIVAANSAYKQAYGVETQDIIGRKCHKVSHRSDVPCHINGEDCPHKKVFETRAPHQVLHIHYDTNALPEHVRIKGSPIFGQDGSMYLGEAVFPLAHSDDLDGKQNRLVGRSKPFLVCIENLTRAAATTAPVLLSGESGVGKDLAAEYIHRRSDRNGHSFTMVDCSAISERVFESELFGHERGAFTGCIGRRYGLFEQADGGTLFFNEIGDLPQSLQGRLLRAMETGQFRRVGGRELLSADARIICATSRNLRQLVAGNSFRADLYYRIAGILCEIPPLRNRREDISEIAEALLQRMSPGKNVALRLTNDAREALKHHDYPGNVRELRNVLQRAAALSTNGIISAAEIHIDSTIESSPAEDAPHFTDTNKPEPSIKGLESRYIAELLAEHQGKRAQVARILGISERTLYRKLKQYGLQSIGRPDSS